MKKSLDFLLGTWDPNPQHPNPQAGDYPGAGVWDGEVETPSWENAPDHIHKRRGRVRSGQVMAGPSLWPSLSQCKAGMASES